MEINKTTEERVKLLESKVTELKDIVSKFMESAYNEFEKRK